MRSTNDGGASPISSDSAAVASNCECNSAISLTNCSIGRATCLLARELVIVIRRLLRNCHHRAAGFDHLCIRLAPHRETQTHLQIHRDAQVDPL